jgi:hypothetical protein
MSKPGAVISGATGDEHSCRCLPALGASTFRNGNVSETLRKDAVLQSCGVEHLLPDQPSLLQDVAP